MRRYPLTLHVNKVWRMDNGNIAMMLKHEPQIHYVEVGETVFHPLTRWQRFINWLRNEPPLKILAKHEDTSTLEIGYD